MSAKDRIRRLEIRVNDEAANAPNVDPAFVSWLETISTTDLRLLEAFIEKMGDEPDDPHRVLFSQCSSYDDAMTMIRSRSETSQEQDAGL